MLQGTNSTRTPLTPNLDPAAQTVLDLGAAEFDALWQRLARRFRRREVRDRARRYLTGLLAPLARHNGWQLAEHLGEANPDGIQRLLNAARWSADALRDDLRQYVAAHLRTPQAVLILDETGFVKKGRESVGVQRQYSGTAGRIENCQLAVFLAYHTDRGTAFIDRELYLPEAWADDPLRRERAGVPAEVSFATKPQLAIRMLERLPEASPEALLPAAWVTADEFYGRDRALRRWLEAHRYAYVLAIARDLRFRTPGATDLRRADQLSTAASTPWERHSAGWGAKGPRWYDWRCVRLESPADAPAPRGGSAATPGARASSGCWCGGAWIRSRRRPITWCGPPRGPRWRTGCA